MQIRELCRPDLAAVARLTQEMAMHPIDNKVALAHATLDAPDSSADLCLVAKEDGQVIGFCFGACRENLGIIRLFGVQTSHRRQRIATLLLDELEKRLKAKSVTRIAVDGIAPGWLFPGVELSRTPAITLLLERGYETNRVARVDMAVDLTQPHITRNLDSRKERLAAKGFALRRATPEDRDTMAAFVRTHFSETWVAEANAAFAMQPIPLFVAVKDDEIVSFAVYDTTGPRRFGPTGTHLEQRGQGLGSTLMRMCMQDMADRDNKQCEIVWVGPVAYYARTLNARIHRAYWTFEKEMATS